MTTQTRQASVTAYYLGRPAALWRTALTPDDPRITSWLVRQQEPAGHPQITHPK